MDPSPNSRRAALLACVVLLAAGSCRVRPAGSARGGLDVKPTPGRPGRFFARIETMGTDGTLTVRLGPDGDAATARRLLSDAVRPLERVVRAMDTYRPDSEISRLNRLGAQEAVTLSADAMRVMRRSVQFSELTGGAFDVTYAPLRTLWREAQKEEKLPSQEAVDRARAAVGSALLVLEQSTARFERPGMEVDLGGIAKGYAIDLAAETMLAQGVAGGIVEVGGDLRVIGRRQNEQKWRVQIRDPRPGTHEPMFLRLADAAVCTSGDYARCFTVSGRRFSHIVDPRTGRPVEGVSSATVVAPDATTADALATAISVLGSREGTRLVEHLPGVECMIVMRTGGKDGSGFATTYSSGFRALTEGAMP